MAEPLRILILEDNPADAELIQFELQEAGFTFNSKTVVTEKDFVHELQEFSPDLILSDYDLPAYNGSLALAEAIKRRPDTPFILVTGAIVEDRAIQILTQGAKDYVLKTRLQQRLVPAVRRALAEAEEHRARKQAEEELREAHRTLEKRVEMRTAELQAEISGRKKMEGALRESEERLRGIIDHTQAGYFFIDRAGRFQHVNSAWLRMHGYGSAEEVIGRHFSLTQPEADMMAAEQQVTNLLAGNSISSGEASRLCKDGSVGYHTFSAHPVIRMGEIVGTEGFIIDTTAHRQLAENYRTLFREMLDGFALHEIICDGQGNPADYRFLAVNPAFERMTGLKAEELVGRTVLEAMPGTERHWIETYGKVALTGKPAFFDNYSAELKKHFEVTAFRPAPGQFACIFADITERKRAEEEKRRNQERAERLAEEMAIIAEIGRAVGSTLDINQVFARVDTEIRKLIPFDRFRVNLKKTDSDEFIVAYASGVDSTRRKLGDSYSIKGTLTGLIMATHTGILIQPEDAEEIRHLYPNLYATFKTGIRSAMNVPLISLDEVIGVLSFRSKKPKAYSSQDLHLAEKIGAQIAGAIVNAQLFNDLNRTEMSLRESEERLHRAEKMEALGQLAGGVAHDLNNVLGVSILYSELLQERIPEENPLRKYVDNIFSSTQKGAAIIEDLLTLARRGVKASDVMNLNSIVTNFLKTPEFEKIQSHHPQVSFRTECQAELLNIKGSPLHLEKTLMNLVANAAEAISGKGEVTIRTENRYLDKPVRGYDEVTEGDYAVLIVSDTGMGIPAENIGKIFEPFYTKKTMGRSGTGLGLAIVWGTVKDHQGYIDLHTEIGEGTTFTLYFPVTREELIAPQQKEPVERYMGKGESILVVDDVAEQRDVAAGLLTRLGYRVQAVSSGEEALEYLAANQADILVLDMIMPPGIDGLETFRRVREINPQQKAIIVSGFAETERVKKAQELGAGAYVRKPYLTERIGLAIRDELTRS